MSNNDVVTEHHPDSERPSPLHLPEEKEPESPRWLPLLGLAFLLLGLGLLGFHCAPSATSVSTTASSAAP